MHNKPQVKMKILRLLLGTLLLILFALWITSLPPFLYLTVGKHSNNGTTINGQLFPSALIAPSEGDVLLLDVRIADHGVAERRGYIVWAKEQGSPSRFPIAVSADDHIHRYVVPIGTYPEWSGTISNVRLVFSKPVADTLTISSTILRQRPFWAIDALLMRALLPRLLAVPPWSSVVLLVATLLGGCAAIIWPRGAWRGRLRTFSVVLGVSVSLLVVGSYSSLLVRLVSVYRPMTTSAMMDAVPAYNESSQVTVVLNDAIQQFPEGPILVLDDDPESYLVYRSRYLFYPHRVDARSPNTSAAELQQLLHSGYAGLIQAGSILNPPAPTWERVAPNVLTPITIWRRPGIPDKKAVVATASPSAPLLGVGLALVIALGWCLAGSIGLPGWGQLIAAWPFGVTLLAWWMFGLSLLQIPWTWWSIGVPAIAVLVVAAYSCLRQGMIRWPQFPQIQVRWSLEVFGVLLLGLLVVAVTVHTVLLPVTDQDAWKIWSLKAKAFYLDGALRPVLSMYAGEDIHHPAYPPALPLLQTWGYMLLGELDERLAKLVFPLWYVCCLAIVWYACRLWTSARAALGWTWLVAATPLVLDHATLNNADLPLAVALLLGAVSLVQWIETAERRWLVGAVMALSGAAWLKLDGLYLGVLMLGIATAVQLLTYRQHRRSAWVLLVSGVGACGVVILVLLPWQLYTATLDLRSDSPGLEGLQREGWKVLWQGVAVISEELLLSHNNSAWGLLGGGFGVLWFVCAGAWMSGWRRFRGDGVLWFLILTVLGGISCYLAIYALRPFFSVERYLLHLAPIAVIAAARATCVQPLQVPGAERAEVLAIRGRAVVGRRRRWTTRPVSVQRGRKE